MPVVTRSQTKAITTKLPKAITTKLPKAIENNSDKKLLINDSYLLARNIISNDIFNNNYRDNKNICILKQNINTHYDNIQIFKKIIREKMTLIQLELNKSKTGTEDIESLCNGYRLVAELYYIIQDWFDILIEFNHRYLLKGVYDNAHVLLERINSIDHSKYTEEQLHAKRIAIQELNSTIDLIEPIYDSPAF